MTTTDNPARKHALKIPNWIRLICQCVRKEQKKPSKMHSHIWAIIRINKSPIWPHNSELQSRTPRLLLAQQWQSALPHSMTVINTVSDWIGHCRIEEYIGGGHWPQKGRDRWIDVHVWKLIRSGETSKSPSILSLFSFITPPFMHGVLQLLLGSECWTNQYAHGISRLNNVQH